MKLNPFKRMPVFIAVGVIATICFVCWLQPGAVVQLEAKTFDARVRLAARFPAVTATNLGFVAISDGSIARLADRSLGFRYDLPWPRHIYGRLIRELSAQGAKAVGFDVLFAEPRPGDSPILVPTNAEPGLLEFATALHPDTQDQPAILGGQVNIESDDFFAWQLHRAGNVILAADDGLLPHKSFSSHSLAPGDISAPKDSDGVLRRAKAFTDHPRARVWQMGIVLAARELGLNLDKAEIDLPRGKIILRGDHGIKRIIPVDASGTFYINWTLTLNHPALPGDPIEKMLAHDILRSIGETNGLDDFWRGKLVMVGSTATGNNLTDRGATPLENDTVLMAAHWNVANSLITGQFIRRSPLVLDFLIIILLGTLAALFSCQLRVLAALAAVLALAVTYVALAILVYVQNRFWIPVFLPVTGALLVQYGSLVTWRVVFEQAEKRRVRSVFSKLVAPDVVRELLEAENLSLNGARREITVLFADVRGFTTYTDVAREQAAEFVRANNLAGAEAEAVFDRHARETLQTINVYLALVADTIKRHGGTLDKYIGDCVMTFWGAPTPQPRHALNAVRAAIDAQRAIDELNRQRSDENSRRELQNFQLAASGQPELQRLPILTLGTGINTGQAIVGLMGSDAHGLNYTVFGREINLASRLESLSGRGRILIGEATFAAIQRDDPALAATCTALPPTPIKGFRDAVQIYEVSWRLPGTVSPIGDDFGSVAGFDTSTTGFLKR